MCAKSHHFLFANRGGCECYAGADTPLAILRMISGWLGDSLKKDSSSLSMAAEDTQGNFVLCDKSKMTASTIVSCPSNSLHNIGLLCDTSAIVLACR
mmetsp:Transcript_11197/g.23825  ORF Transcript_11197/g.23825 Transcript_11197/m.23825 type:complete len:97 (+) Transcript_11197:1309-1599(+)